MKKFKHLLVALDHSKMDEDLIQYTSFFANHVKAKRIYFIHNIKKYDSDEILDRLVDFKTIQEQIQKEILEKIQTHYTGKTDYELIISNDPFTESLISYTVSRFKIDLTIIGKKNDLDRSATLTGKLLRSLKCSMLVVPQNPSNQFDNILVGTDFSVIAQRAARIAFKLQKKGTQVNFAHVYTTPNHYLPFLKEEKIIKMTEQYADQQLEEFITNAQLNAAHSSFHKINRKDDNISICLQKLADENHYDLLVIGDKGQNWLSSFFIGSVAEKLYNIPIYTPTLVVK
ncbi:hypothetical protein UJ101_00453 [Flavobacteriaceae bacterium UJ101]|nr:hypothetical protein UJ101_00453 [Flavobacteriaceae bacterium UJ101]